MPLQERRFWPLLAWGLTLAVWLVFAGVVEQMSLTEGLTAGFWVGAVAAVAAAAGQRSRRVRRLRNAR